MILQLNNCGEDVVEDVVGFAIICETTGKTDSRKSVATPTQGRLDGGY
jgi:hypothetical protein